jgi:hypothetical protein
MAILPYIPFEHPSLPRPTTLSRFSLELVARLGGLWRMFIVLWTMFITYDIASAACS